MVSDQYGAEFAVQQIMNNVYPAENEFLVDNENHNDVHDDMMDLDEIWIRENQRAQMMSVAKESVPNEDHDAISMDDNLNRGN